MEWNKDQFSLYDSPERVNEQRVFELLATTYWSANRTMEKVQKMVQHSLCFSLYDGDHQIGFARAITDYTTFSWVADVIVDDAYRGQKLGVWIMECMMQHPAIAHTQFALQTGDAHGLYEKFGFSINEALMSTKVSYLD